MVAMSRPASLLCLAFAASLCLPAAQGASLRGSLGLDSLVFAEPPQFAGQADEYRNAAATLNLTLSDRDYHLELFSRASANTEKAWSADLRQSTWNLRSDASDWQVGVLSQTWGVLEAWNPVDVINVRDLAEDFQGKAKLGQPGAMVSLNLDDTVLSLYALTYARGQRLGEGRDRLRSLPAAVREEAFEDGRWAPGFAARAAFKLGSDLELALSHYRGHAREPLLQPLVDARGLRGFRATYAQIEQTTLQAQYVVGDSVLKSEVIHQRGTGERFWGGGVGAETTFSRVGASTADLTLYSEFYYDARSADAPVTPFQRDLFFGARLSLNDPQDSVLELRASHDLQWSSHLFELRASRRVFASTVFSAALLAPSQARRDPALNGYGNDTYLKLGLAWYF